jgi:hypothetical protein
MQAAWSGTHSAKSFSTCSGVRNRLRGWYSGRKAYRQNFVGRLPQPPFAPRKLQGNAKRDQLLGNGVVTDFFLTPRGNVLIDGARSHFRERQTHVRPENSLARFIHLALWEFEDAQEMAGLRRVLRPSSTGSERQCSAHRTFFARRQSERAYTEPMP